MTWRFDGDQLVLHAGTLRAAGSRIDQATSAVSTTLSNVARSSGATRALAAVVDDLYARAADLDARAAMLATHHALFTGRLDYPAGLTGMAQPDQLDLQAARVDVLQARIDNWSGSDNDPILDGLIASQHEAERVYRAGLGSAYRSAMASRSLSARLMTHEAWAQAVYEAAAVAVADYARTMALLDGLELTEEAMWNVGQAMANGLSPSQVGLPAFLFPAEYVDRMQAVDDLRARALTLDRLLSATRDEIRRLDAEMFNSMSGPHSTAHPRDFSEIYDDLTGALAREQALETELKELRNESDTIDYQAETREIVTTLLDSPGLTDRQRGELAGSFLASLWPDFHDLSVNPAPSITDIGSILPTNNRFATSAFFQALGPEQTSLIPAFIQAFELPDTFLSNYASAMSSASHQLPPTFGADVIESFGEVWQRIDLPYALMNAHYYGAVAELFAHPMINYSFLLNTYDASESTFTNYYDGHQIFDFQSDPRSVLLTSLQDNANFAPGMFLTDQRADRLFDDAYADDGLAVANLLVALGQKEDSPDVQQSVSAVIRAIASQNRPLQDLTAVGSALMVHQHMGVFIPTNTWDDNTGAFVGPLEPEYRDIVRTRIGVSQTELRIFLERVMRQPTASAVVLESAALYVHHEITLLDSTDAIYRQLDELALLLGYVSDIAGDLAVQSGYDHDKSNALKAALVGSLMKVAITGSFALIPAGSVVVLAGKAIGSGAANFGVGQATDHFFPTDAEVEVYRQRLDQLTGVDLKPLQFAAIAAAYDHDPSGFDQTTMPTGLLEDGHLLRPGDQVEYHGTSEQMIGDLWDAWLLAGVTNDDGQNAALRWANEAIERLFADASSPLFGPSRPITSG